MENQCLHKEFTRLKRQLRKADAMLDFQEKAAEILGYSDETEENNS